MSNLETTSKQVKSKRAVAQSKMLEEALARPGIREYLEVYARWQEKDRNLEPWRQATRYAAQVVTTNVSHTS